LRWEWNGEKPCVAYIFNMVDCNPVSTPTESGLVLSRHSDVSLTREEELELLELPYRRLIGLLMYLAIATRPDIALAMQKLARFLTFYRPVIGMQQNGLFVTSKGHERSSYVSVATPLPTSLASPTPAMPAVRIWENPLALTASHLATAA
jgi:hypothetical protein